MPPFFFGEAMERALLCHPSCYAHVVSSPLNPSEENVMCQSGKRRLLNLEYQVKLSTTQLSVR